MNTTDSKSPSPPLTSFGAHKASALAALAAQIGVLTHVTDRLEQLGYSDTIQSEIDTLHSTIDALNALYELNKDLDTLIQSDNDSLLRRLRVVQASAEKHHNGNIAACERADKLCAVLESLVRSPDLNLDNMDDGTYVAIDAAKRLLYPDVETA